MTNPVITREDVHPNTPTHEGHRPLAVFHKLHNEMNKLFDDFGRGLSPWRSGWREPFTECQAKVDLKDTGTEIVLTADVPGVELKDLDIAATPHYVSISGEKRAEMEASEPGYYRMERDYGFFRRVIPLPCEIDRDKINAVFKNGVLTVTMPKTKEAIENEHKIVVKAG